MRAYFPPFGEDEYVFLEDTQTYARRSECEMWRGRRWVLVEWADRMRAFRGVTPEEMDARTQGDTVRDRGSAVLGDNCFPGG